jgi:hypothetical protein
MKNPTNRDGWLRTAAATDSSSPGMLAISAARRTLWASSSLTHRADSDSGESGASQPSS